MQVEKWQGRDSNAAILAMAFSISSHKPLAHETSSCRVDYQKSALLRTLLGRAPELVK